MSVFCKRLKILATNMMPFLLVYLAYFCFLQFHVYPNSISARIIQKKQYNLTNIPQEVDYLVLGDSTGLYNINPTLFSSESFSASSIGESSYLSYRTLLSLSNIKIKKGILLTQTFISSHYDEDIWKYHVPIGNLNISEVTLMKCGIAFKECSNLTILLIKLKYLLTKLYLADHSLEALSYSLKNYFAAPFIYEDKSFLKNLIKNHGHYPSPKFFALSKYQFLNPYYKDFKNELKNPPSVELYYFNEIIKHASALGLNVYYVITPMRTNYIKRFSDNSKYNNNLNKIIYNIKKSNFKIIDGRKFNEQLENLDYIDYNHLNEKGSIKFSKYLSDLLITL